MVLPMPRDPPSLCDVVTNMSPLLRSRFERAKLLLKPSTAHVTALIDRSLGRAEEVARPLDAAPPSEPREECPGRLASDIEISGDS